MPSRTILIVDDDQAMTTMLTQYFGQRGYVVHSAHSGTHGLEKAIELRPDVVLLDLVLPGISGSELLAELRGRRVFLKVIMLTHKGDLQTAINLVKAGAFDFVAKPFEIEELFWHVERAIALQKTEVTPRVTHDNPTYREFYATIDSLLGSQNYDAAMVEAFKFLEERLRTILQVPAEEYYGERLINYAFAQNDGKLQIGGGESEQRGLRNLVSGAYAVFRNPAAHRQAQFDEFSVSAVVNIVVLICDLAQSIRQNSAKL